jgi:hypothetical protein
MFSGRRFAHLQSYFNEYGHCRVPATYKTTDGYKLGQWVRIQRTYRDGLSESRRDRLNELDFVWDPHAEQWEEGFAHLEAFFRDHGHCRVAQSYKEADGYMLGRWAHKQRQAYRNGKLRNDRKARLDALGFFETEPKAAAQKQRS